MNKFLNRYTFLSIIFLIVNFFIFYDALTVTFFTGSVVSMFFYLSLYLLVSLFPTFISFGSYKYIKYGLLITLIIFFVTMIILILQKQAINVIQSKNVEPNQVITSDIFVEQELRTLQGLKNISFCFYVLVPSYFPAQILNDLPEEMRDEPLYNVYYNQNADCSRQMVALTYKRSMKIIQVPKTYDYTARRGLENLALWRKLGLESNEKETINDTTVHFFDLEKSYSGDFGLPDQQEGYRLAYIEKEDTTLFIRYTPIDFWNNGNGPGYTNEDILKTVQSLERI